MNMTCILRTGKFGTIDSRLRFNSWSLIIGWRTPSILVSCNYVGLPLAGTSIRYLDMQLVSLLYCRKQWKQWLSYWLSLSSSICYPSMPEAWVATTAPHTPTLLLELAISVCRQKNTTTVSPLLQLSKLLWPSIPCRHPLSCRPQRVKSGRLKSGTTED